jgi:hypothetical protein
MSLFAESSPPKPGDLYWEVAQQLRACVVDQGPRPEIYPAPNVRGFDAYVLDITAVSSDDLGQRRTAYLNTMTKEFFIETEYEMWGGAMITWTGPYRYKARVILAGSGL